MLFARSLYIGRLWENVPARACAMRLDSQDSELLNLYGRLCRVSLLRHLQAKNLDLVAGSIDLKAKDEEKAAKKLACSQISALEELSAAKWTVLAWISQI